MNTVPPKQLANLIVEARQYPVGSLKRQRLLTDIIRQMQRSGKIWRDHYLTPEQYQEALQRTWVWFCQHLDHYDPDQSNPITWFNCTLKFRIKDLLREEMVRDAQRQQPIAYDDTEALDPISNLPAPPLDQSLQMLTALGQWLRQTRPQLEQKALRHRPEVNAYVLMLRRLPIAEQASWQELSQEFGVAIPTLSSFYQRQCLPLLQEFGRSQGWLEEETALS